MPSKITKTEIRQWLLDAIQATVSKYGVSSFSKKQSKIIERFSKKLAVDIKDEIKKKIANEEKLVKVSEKKSRKKAAVLQH